MNGRAVVKYFPSLTALSEKLVSYLYPVLGLSNIDNDTLPINTAY